MILSHASVTKSKPSDMGELFQDLHLPTTESLNPCSSFVSFLPVTVKGLRTSPSLWGPVPQTPAPPFPSIIPFLFCIPIRSLSMVSGSFPAANKHSLLFPILEKSFFAPPPTITLALWALFPFTAMFHKEMAYTPSSISAGWGGAVFYSLWPWREGPVTIYPPPSTLSNYSCFFNFIYFSW